MGSAGPRSGDGLQHGAAGGRHVEPREVGGRARAVAGDRGEVGRGDVRDPGLHVLVAGGVQRPPRDGGQLGRGRGVVVGVVVGGGGRAGQGGGVRRPEHGGGEGLVGGAGAEQGRGASRGSTTSSRGGAETDLSSVAVIPPMQVSCHVSRVTMVTCHASDLPRGPPGVQQGPRPQGQWLWLVEVVILKVVEL